MVPATICFGYNLPMAGYTLPPGVYFSEHSICMKAAPNANITFPLGRNTARGPEL